MPETGESWSSGVVELVATSLKVSADSLLAPIFHWS